MQTALALRDVVMTVADMVVYVLVYFITSGVICPHSMLGLSCRLSAG